MLTFNLNIQMPAAGSLNTRLSDWQSTKYCFANDLKLSAISTEYCFGGRNGEETEIDNSPFMSESGSDKNPGFPIKSI
jgi:hypothetical protein